MIENNKSPQNTPINPKATAKQSQEAAVEVQEQFIPQVQSSDPIHTEHHTPKTDLDRLLTKYIRYVRKTVVWGLIAQSLFGIYKSIRFILVELPTLELELENNLITQDSVNGFASKSVVLAISAIVGIGFAMKLSTVQNKTAKRIQTAIGILLVLGNVWLTNFLNSQQSGQLIGEFAFSLLNKFR